MAIKTNLQFPTHQPIAGRFIVNNAWLQAFEALERNFNETDTALSGKATLTTGAAEGNLAEFDSDGDVVDSEISSDKTILSATPVSAVSDASAVSTITLGAGGDTVNKTQLQTDLNTLVSEINSLRTQLNAALQALRDAGVINT